MSAKEQTMNMPELPIFAKSLACGFLLAEVWRISFYLGSRFALTLVDRTPWASVVGVLFGAALCLTYLSKRGAFAMSGRIARSYRVDLLATFGIGFWINALASPWMNDVHDALKGLDPYWTPAVVATLFVLLLSPLVRHWPKAEKAALQMTFFADEEIAHEEDDLLASDTQANSFARIVLESSAHPGLVFGVDGPWGVGKTSFINLAQRAWEEASDRVIVCRFEPLRYASEVDLADKLIRELSSIIQRKVFAPEFRPAASRYSRLLKGRADVSFLGFRLSLESGQETLDELLDDIDDVLKRIGRRVIIVIDDLDRLDAKAINSVLFATRRTFKLSQATFILCYDTEILVSSKEENSKAREFLEKFVTVKMSLFIDSTKIQEFLMRDWRRPEHFLGSVPSDTMFKLSAVLTELASILASDLAAQYFPLVGDLRKIKRFVNAMLLMQIEKTDLGMTDFNKRDLINLILLHLNFPGLFRRLYSEETDGRTGFFSVHRDRKDQRFKNSQEFSEILSRHTGAASFLLTQLFDVKTLGIDSVGVGVGEAALTSRACFNHEESRNLEKYLKFIVRFVAPEPKQTFVLYQRAVDRVQKEKMTISSILVSAEFRLDDGEVAHEKFWNLLVNQSHRFTDSVTDDAILTIVEYLPRYSSIDIGNYGLRQTAIYSLLRLLDSAGRSSKRRSNNSKGICEIAQRIFGEGAFKGKGLLKQLSEANRGVLGWNDLMLFRLLCSADRNSQLYNVQNALIAHQNLSVSKSQFVNEIAREGMRHLSQAVFLRFKRTYIDANRNFYSEVNSETDDAFIGESGSANLEISLSKMSHLPSVAQVVMATRSSVKIFVIYQLVNMYPPTGSGVGCGYYDEKGLGDKHGIADVMNAYVFDVCFNPLIDEGNAFHFLDFCLSHLSRSFNSGEGESRYIATKGDLLGGFDPMKMGQYWSKHQALIRLKAEQHLDRQVVTSNYVASYQNLTGVYTVLDEFASEAGGPTSR